MWLSSRCAGLVAGAALAFQDAVEISKTKNRVSRNTFFPPTGATEGKAEAQCPHSRLTIQQVHGFNGVSLLQTSHGALVYASAALVVVSHQEGEGPEARWKQAFFDKHDNDVVGLQLTDCTY